MFLLARAVRIATGVAVTLLSAGILIHVLEANTSNHSVSVVNDAAKWLAQPFHGMFSPEGEKTGSP